MSFIFPRPSPPHYEYNTYPHLHFLPKTKSLEADIPFYLLPWPGSDLLLIYSHPNAADIGSMYTTFKYYQKFWKVNVLLWEYPGYGCNLGTPSESSINANLVEVVRFVKSTLRVPLSKCIFYGQSIGGGPASWMVGQLNRQNVKTGGLILQCAFTSLQAVATSLVGSWAASLIDDFWHNDKQLTHVTDGVLIIHGKNDRIIPWQQAHTNFTKCKSKQKTLHLCEEASHNEWEPFSDIIYPIEDFINKIHRPAGTPADPVSMVEEAISSSCSLHDPLASSLPPLLVPSSPTSLPSFSLSPSSSSSSFSCSSASSSSSSSSSSSCCISPCPPTSVLTVPSSLSVVPQAVLDDYHSRFAPPTTPSTATTAASNSVSSSTTTTTSDKESSMGDFSASAASSCTQLSEQTADSDSTKKPLGSSNSTRNRGSKEEQDRGAQGAWGCFNMCFAKRAGK